MVSCNFIAPWTHRRPYTSCKSIFDVYSLTQVSHQFLIQLPTSKPTDVPISSPSVSFDHHGTALLSLGLFPQLMPLLNNLSYFIACFDNFTNRPANPTRELLFDNETSSSYHLLTILFLSFCASIILTAYIFTYSNR